MASQKPETVFNIDTLFADINESFLTAVDKLQTTFESEKWLDSPYVYHMPKMHLSMRLALSHSDGKVKGVFSRRSTQKEESLTSLIEVDLVAIPRQPPQVDVAWLQRSLNTLLGTNLEIDGALGAEPRGAIKLFQTGNELKVDGAPNLQTIAKIRQMIEG